MRRGVTRVRVRDRVVDSRPSACSTPPRATTAGSVCGHPAGDSIVELSTSQLNLSNIRELINFIIIDYAIQSPLP